MNYETLLQFFQWCTIINGSLLLIWTLVFMAAPEAVFKTQKKWFPMDRAVFTPLFYGFLGLFKVFFIFFNLVPLIALLIIG